MNAQPPTDESDLCNSHNSKASMWLSLHHHLDEVWSTGQNNSSATCRRGLWLSVAWNVPVFQRVGLEWHDCLTSWAAGIPDCYSLLGFSSGQFTLHARHSSKKELRLRAIENLENGCVSINWDADESLKNILFSLVLYALSLTEAFMYIKFSRNTLLP